MIKKVQKSEEGVSYLCCGFFTGASIYSGCMETLLELGQKFPMAAEYLSQMYLIQRDYREVSNSRLAQRLGVSRSAVTQAIKRLVNLDLVEHEGSHYELSDKGRDFATSLITRHYLIEHLLVEVLEYPWDRADQEASLLQDKISADFTAFLFDKLGRPTTCPHGNPFPETGDESRLLGAYDLTRVNVGTGVRILRITEEGEEVEGLLSFCYQHRIRPGKDFSIIDRKPDFVIIQAEDGEQPFSVTIHFARYLRVEILSGS